MRAVFSDRGRLQGMLDFEAALARAQARVGVIPDEAAETIVDGCHVDLFDIGELALATATSGTPAIPVVRRLRRVVAATNAEAAKYVHWGVTSQDVMDTGLVLQVRQALDLLQTDAEELEAALTALATEHRETPLAGRTWLQQAVPTTFGLKVAGWLDALRRDRARLRTAYSTVSTLQLGGAAGTLFALGDRAEEIGALLAEELGLSRPDVPWHTHRDRLVEVALTLGLLVGSLGKVARDISLMTQSEVGEVSEPSAPGRGGSSSMPQKRNPVGCAATLAASTRVPALVSTMLSAMPQEHERGLGGWHAEWETLPEVFLLASGGLAQMRDVIAGLRVHPDRMRANLEANGGIAYAESVSSAIAPIVGHGEAHEVVARACRTALEQGQALREVVLAEEAIRAHLSAEEVEALFDPRPHVLAAARMVDRVLAAHATD
jgi:3-carboxy-cis,cis-muconate cycloisomerase